MMNELNKKILELFRYLINSGTKHLSEIDYSGCSLKYKIDGKEIILRFTKVDSEEKVKPNLYTTIEKLTKSRVCIPFFAGVGCKTPNFNTIQYSIMLGGKQYIVPKLSRLEQAQSLDRLDAILEERESEILDSVLNKLTVDSREEL